MKKPVAPALNALQDDARIIVKRKLITELGLKDFRSLEPYVYGKIDLAPLAEKFIRSTFADYGINW